MNPYHIGVVFLSGEHLILEPVPMVREWIVFRDYSVLINGRTVTIPEGFITDLASVPAIVRVVVDDNDPDILRPAVIHDFLYQRHGQATPQMIFTRRECDQVLAQAMKALGARLLRRHIVFLGVRLGGWLPWSKTRI